MNYTYRDLLERVNRLGEPVNPRGTETKELLNASLETPLGILPRRQGLVRALGYMELCQWVGCLFDLEALKRVAPTAKHELFTPQMAYGTRMTRWRAGGQGSTSQLQLAAEELASDPASRRAVVVLSSPLDELDQRPCTTSVQFLTRRGATYVTVNLRSWDLWWGAPYDLVMYHGLGMMMARVLGTELGTLTVNAASAHVYKPYWGKGIERQDYQYDVLNFREGLPRTWAGLRRWAYQEVADVKWISGPPLGLYESGVREWSSGHSAPVGSPS